MEKLQIAMSTQLNEYTDMHILLVCVSLQVVCHCSRMTGVLMQSTQGHKSASVVHQVRRAHTHTHTRTHTDTHTQQTDRHIHTYIYTHTR